MVFLTYDFWEPELGTMSTQSINQKYHVLYGPFSKINFKITIFEILVLKYSFSNDEILSFEKVGSYQVFSFNCRNFFFDLFDFAFVFDRKSRILTSTCLWVLWKTIFQNPGVDLTKLFFVVNEEFFHFFATKLGHCTVPTFFSYVTNSQA